MSSTREYLDFVLDLLAEVPDLQFRKMMGEYVLYSKGKVFGGVYDDRFQYPDRCGGGAPLRTVLEKLYALDRRNGSAGVCTGAYIIR